MDTAQPLSPSPLSLLAVPQELRTANHAIVSRVAAVLAGAAGMLVLLGWAIRSQVLRALGPESSAAMNPTAALLLVLSGVAIWLLSKEPRPVIKHLARGIASLVLLAGLGRVAVLLSLFSVPVDGVLFGDAMRGTADGRLNLMAPNAALDFIMLAFALLLTARRTPKAAIIAQALAVLVLLSSLVAVMAYAYESGWFDTIGRFNRMARGTAVAFIALSIGTIALQGSQSLLSVVLSDGPGGALARSLLPAGLFVPTLFGWLTLLTRREEIMNSDVANMVFVVAITVVFVVLICWNAVQLHESHLVRLRAEEAMRESEVRFRLLAENGSDVVTLHDLSGRVTYVSPSCERVLGFLPEELQRMTPFAIVHPDDSDKLRRHFDALMRGEPVVPLSCRVLHKSGRHIWLETMWRAVVDHDGKVIRLQASARDITERKEYERRLEEAQRKLTVQQEHLMDANVRLEALAMMDGLTGLKNRRAFEERMVDEIARARRTNRPLSLLLLDIDHFKQYNDSFGHPRGDEVLRNVARHLTRCMRDTDYAARYGGEEFALLLPDADREGAAQLAERLREMIEEAAWEGRPVTVSIGVATLSRDVATPEMLVEHADRALYRSKQNGRNLVTA
jgi:diguanylate cyclase (GGDEF)-like protein/PAS domain S-box-containing protein